MPTYLRILQAACFTKSLKFVTSQVFVPTTHTDNLLWNALIGSLLFFIKKRKIILKVTYFIFMLYQLTYNNLHVHVLYLATFACSGDHNNTLTLKPTKKLIIIQELNKLLEDVNKSQKPTLHCLLQNKCIKWCYW